MPYPINSFMAYRHVTIVSGLKYLHDNKIVHRDLKPENVMFSNEKFQLPVKIGDFGLCRTIHSSESQTGSLTSRIGTLEYMAPEIFTHDYSFQADLFSLGLVIWEVFQLIPFKERKTLFDKLVNDKEEGLVGQMSLIGVREIVLNLTKRNKVDRMQSVDEIVGIFETVRTGEDLRTRLENVANGESVVLGEGVYVEFVLKQDNVEIVGAGGGKTILKGLKDKACLAVVGSYCTISDLKVISEEGSIGINLRGSRNTIRNVEASGGITSFNVLGEGNRLENLTIYDAEKGIVLEGFRHIVDHVKMDNIGAYGILVSGYSSNFSNIDLIKQNSSRGFYGMRLFGTGFNNTISNLTCSGYSRNNNDWGLQIDLPDTTVNDSKCGPVWVRGKNVNLTNVDCREKIEILKGAIGVNLRNCSGQAVVAPREATTITNCSFVKITQY